MFSSNASQVSDSATYIEDVFSTHLYTGNGSTQTITNGIDLAGEGGMVWCKSRSVLASSQLYDTNRGATKWLITNSSSAESTLSTGLTSFNSDGFSVGSSTGINGSGTTYASWTFRKQPKFFDVVTYTGNAAASQAINHNLGSAPGFMIVKATNTTGFWYCYHRSLGATKAMTLNTTDAESTLTNYWFNTAPTSTQFTVGTVNNDSGVTYVAYLFAHDAGGFGLTGTDNVISCGSYTGNGSATGPIVTLGYEPQWLLTKRTDLSADWQLVDTMRGMSSAYNRLFPNSSAVEDFESDGVTPTATGFKLTGVQPTHNASGGTYIYIAIRRGPMKTPTTGTSVFKSVFGDGTPPAMESGFVVDAGLVRNPSTTADNNMVSRLTGTANLVTNSTAAEGTFLSSQLGWDYNTGFMKTYPSSVWSAMFRRAPGFMDVCCYTGTGANLTLSHNLTVKPELALFKRRSGVDSWVEFHNMNASTYSYTFFTSAAGATQPYGTGYRLQAEPTATAMYLNDYSSVNTSGATYVAYLFASCLGVSKVFNYTGNGSSQTINCGFTGGARFVMIKRTDSTGDWYVWDSARGIVSGNDPRLSLNTTAAEVTTDDSVDTDSTGFVVNQLSATNVNVNGASYIGLAIA